MAKCAYKLHGLGIIKTRNKRIGAVSKRENQLHVKSVMEKLNAELSGVESELGTLKCWDPKTSIVSHDLERFAFEEIARAEELAVRRQFLLKDIHNESFGLNRTPIVHKKA